MKEYVRRGDWLIEVAGGVGADDEFDPVYEMSGPYILPACRYDAECAKPPVSTERRYCAEHDVLARFMVEPAKVEP